MDESGGGLGPDPEREWVDFYVHIPLDSAERDAEVRRYLAKLEKSRWHRSKSQRRLTSGRWSGLVSWFTNTGWAISKWRAASWMVTA
jgi:hypothetical protein